MAKLNIYLLLIQPFNPKDPIRVLDFIFVYCRLDLTWPLKRTEDKPL
jgi:hypothetical protein